MEGAGFSHGNLPYTTRCCHHKLILHKRLLAAVFAISSEPLLPDRPQPKATFESLGLSDVMLDALEQATYEYPTPIQAGLIPLALKEIDVVGQARTGTGKTASFAIPILEKLQLNHDIHHPQALVMVPTRELAVQVKDEIVKLSAGRRVHCVAVYGGKPIRQQIEKLRKGAHIIVGTPGRVLDHLARGTVDLSKLTFVVLDEAD